MAEIKKAVRRVIQYHKRIIFISNNEKLDERYIGQIDNLKADIKDAYARGKITDQQYCNLKEEISILYEIFYQRKIDLLSELNDNEKSEVMFNNIRNDIKDAYARGKITSPHYNL